MRKIADNPYPGSRAFTQADQEFFFGRDADIAVIVDLWMTNRLTVVSGAAGCGKTSLLQAGVRPLLREKTSQHRHRALPSGNLSGGMSFPSPALTEHNPFTLALLRSWVPDDVPTRLAGLSVSDFVRDRTRGHDGVTYAAVDALDDLALGPQAGAWAKWRREFLAGLAQALADHPRLHLLLVTRTTGLSLLTSSVGVGARHSITGLTPRAAIAAIRKPAMAAGRTFADNAAHGIVIDLLSTPESAELPSDRHVEPSLLQAVCSRLWEELPPSVTEISDRTIREVQRSRCEKLADYCGQIIAEVSTLHGVSPRKLHSWLVASFITGRGTCGGLHEDAAHPPAKHAERRPQRDLLDRHLLTSQLDESTRYYRLLSNRLIDPLRTASAAWCAAAAVTAPPVSCARPSWPWHGGNSILPGRTLNARAASSPSGDSATRLVSVSERRQNRCSATWPTGAASQPRPCLITGRRPS